MEHYKWAADYGISTSLLCQITSQCFLFQQKNHRHCIVQRDTHRWNQLDPILPTRGRTLQLKFLRNGLRYDLHTVESRICPLHYGVLLNPPNCGYASQILRKVYIMLPLVLSQALSGTFLGWTHTLLVGDLPGRSSMCHCQLCLYARSIRFHINRHLELSNLRNGCHYSNIACLGHHILFHLD